jgi:ABC-type sugar transport system ATPase subunit
MVSLSGGNQQKAIIGKWLSNEPGLCILDEPTKGVDIGARAAVHKLIVDLAAKGVAFILISSDLAEIVTLAHRVVVLHKGRLAGSIQRAQFEPSRIVHMASMGRDR